MASPTITVKWDTNKINSITERAKKGLVRMAYDIGNQARRNAPYMTGALSSSIRVEENGDEIWVMAGGRTGAKDIRYAAIQEFGGKAGRNHSVTITGKHYLRNAEQAIMSGDYLKKYLGEIL